ncbi:ribosomal protein S27-domain-containing protein [Xylariaceae sp. FL0255]|nr:ribosomal protein S27-domain-containing protein [Xylariaceae sp. FL0255]
MSIRPTKIQYLPGESSRELSSTHDLFPSHLLQTIYRQHKICRSHPDFRLLVLAVDLLNPSPAAEAKKHKLKTLVPAPRSFFMDVKCPGCFTITTVFSHAQTVVICQGCTTVLCQPTGGKARLTEGCSFRRK